jgi:hypothetical protein
MLTGVEGDTLGCGGIVTALENNVLLEGDVMVSIKMLLGMLLGSR